MEALVHRSWPPRVLAGREWREAWRRLDHGHHAWLEDTVSDGRVLHDPHQAGLAVHLARRLRRELQAVVLLGPLTLVLTAVVGLAAARFTVGESALAAAGRALWWHGGVPWLVTVGVGTLVLGLLTRGRRRRLRAAEDANREAVAAAVATGPSTRPVDAWAAGAPGSPATPRSVDPPDR